MQCQDLFTDTAESPAAARLPIPSGGLSRPPVPAGQAQVPCLRSRRQGSPTESQAQISPLLAMTGAKHLTSFPGMATVRAGMLTASFASRATSRTPRPGSSTHAKFVNIQREALSVGNNQSLVGRKHVFGVLNSRVARDNIDDVPCVSQ